MAYSVLVIFGDWVGFIVAFPGIEFVRYISESTGVIVGNGNDFGSWVGWLL